MKIGISLFTVFVAICVFISVQGQRNNDDCMVDGFVNNCIQYINATCENATLITNRLAYIDICPMLTILWDAPYYNLTILFESHLLKPYELCVTPVLCTKAFQTSEDGNEIPVDWNPQSFDPVCFGTNDTSRPTMRFRFDAQHQTSCLRTPITFYYKV